MTSHYQIIIANRILSSWSLRGWLVMRWSGLPFETMSVFMDHDDFSEKMRVFTPLGLAPALVIRPDEGESYIVSDSLAIAETMAEIAPQLWPQDAKLRAKAREICTMIHASGIAALRSECSMNISARYSNYQCSAAVSHELALLTLLITKLIGDNKQALMRGSIDEKPGIIDAFLAPVASRVDTYHLPVADPCKSYFQALLKQPAIKEWLLAAQSEELDPLRQRNMRYANRPYAKMGDFPLLRE